MQPDLVPDLASSALFLDVDGTLVDIAPRPDAVIVEAGLPAALAAARDRLGGALALVSGRRIADLDGLFAPLQFAAAGAHGAELRRAPELPIETAPDLPDALRSALADLASAVPGVLVEDKGVAVAVHTRAVPDASPDVAARVAAIVAASGIGDRLALLRGKAVLEVKPSGMDKGRAVESLLARAPFAGRTPVFVGDDVTDEAGFAAALGAGGKAIAVGRSFPGASTLAGPADVRAALRRLAAA